MLKGRGAQIQVKNKFLKQEYVAEHIEGLDEPLIENSKTKYISTFPKTIVNKVDSPDLGLAYSLNPYQGCEHGCIYCYARNSHEYWGYSAGLDFERVILVKQNAASLLEKFLQKPKWQPQTIMISGNTDCYQPIERKLKITRSLLEVFLKYKHPVGMITKNVIILRDLDLIKPLADLQLITIALSITSLDEYVRRKLEPRTATAKAKLNAMQKLADAGVPCRVMIGPVIPGLNDHEIPDIMKSAADAGAKGSIYTIIRLNGAIGGIFTNWVKEAFPGRAEKIISQIKGMHNGKLNDSRFGLRMTGEGNMVASIHRMMELSRNKYFDEENFPKLRKDLFVKTNKGQMGLF